MKHVYLFFGQKVTEEIWRLEKSEIFHIKNVLRLPVGSRIQLTNGLGSKVTGQIAKDFEFVTVETSKNVTNDHGRHGHFSLMQAILKKDLIEEIVPGLVEVGVDAIYFYPQAHAPKGIFSEKLAERVDNLSTAAVKQSKRFFKPAVEFFADWEMAAKFLAESKSNKVVFSADAEEEVASLNAFSQIGLCGSEAGFSEIEETFFREQNFQSVKISQPILRARTAAVVGSALVLSRLQKIL